MVKTISGVNRVISFPPDKGDADEAANLMQRNEGFKALEHQLRQLRQQPDKGEGK